MTRQDLIDKGYEDSVVFENPSYDGCIIGVTTDRIMVYSLSQMVAWYSKNEKCSEREALEFIEYNTIRALSYQANAPVILDDL